MTAVVEALKSVQFLVDPSGRRVAVQLSMAAWEVLLNWVEDQEDAAIVEVAIPQLKQLQDGLETEDWLDWDAVQDQWNED